MDHLSKKKVCPTDMCRATVNPEDVSLVPSNLINMINELRVKCVLCGNENLHRGIFDNHIDNDCPKAIVKCLAVDVRCPWEGTRDQLTEHLKTCIFYQLRSVLHELIEKNQQQSSQLDKLAQQIEHQKTQLHDVQIENQKQIDAITRDHQQQYAQLEKQIQEFQNPYEHLQPTVSTLVADQLCTQLAKIQLETQSNFQNQYQNEKKEIVALCDKRYTKLDAAINAIREDNQDQFHPKEVVNERCKLLEDQIAIANEKIIQLKKEIQNSKDNTEVRTTAFPSIASRVTWTYSTDTVAGGHGSGKELNQLSNPLGLCMDSNQTVYIADSHNHRIIEWKYGNTSGQVVAGGIGEGSRLDQLSHPTDVIVYEQENSIIICDSRNRRVVQWSRSNDKKRKQIIDKIDCYGLAMDQQGSLYVSDYKMHQVICLRSGQTTKVIVAGNGEPGAGFHQLNEPRYISVDKDYSVYVTDCLNHRVMKWPKNAKKGDIVAGGGGHGNDLTQLHNPQGLFVDSLGNIYVADLGNHRVMCWRNGIGTVVVDGNNHEGHTNQLNYPTGLSFDQNNNLYVADSKNHRVQRFSFKDRN